MKNRLPAENIYTTRCPQCGCLILLGGNELRRRWEQPGVTNHGYMYKCPGCEGRVSYTTDELLIHKDEIPVFMDFDDYIYAHDRVIGHGIILDEGESKL